MITVKTEKNGHFYKGITILGHAMYDDYGKDIVCGAVSSIVITTINAILSLKKDTITYLVSKKGLSIKVQKEDKITNTLIRNMISLLKELSVKYQENIEVK